jgi:hypothetical protein
MEKNKWASKEEVEKILESSRDTIRSGNSFTHSLIIACDVLKAKKLKFRGNDVLSILPSFLRNAQKYKKPTMSIPELETNEEQVIEESQTEEVQTNEPSQETGEDV